MKREKTSMPENLGLLESGVDWMFWPNMRPRSDSAWGGHVPFAHWLVAEGKPSVLVELGTHSGVSYSAFCEAVLRRSLATRCHAVDTWVGDPQAGAYPEAVYEDLAAFNGQRYGAFSILHRTTFDGALSEFPDRSIDILHIDGFHSYEAVKHDFETWRPKLSSRAIVLFHDTNERQPGFGVWRYWAELRQDFPGFEFLHSHGLGVLQVGAEAPAGLAFLCGLTDVAVIEQVRFRFQFLGEHIEMHADILKMTRTLRQYADALQDARAKLARIAPGGN